MDECWKSIRMSIQKRMSIQMSVVNQYRRVSKREDRHGRVLEINTNGIEKRMPTQTSVVNQYGRVLKIECQHERVLEINTDEY